MTIKIGVTGYNGLLGSRLVSYLRKMQYLVTELDYENIFIDDSGDAFLGLDVVVHCAALTNVDRCELHYDESYRANVTLTKCLTKLFHGRIIYISSTGVYGEHKNTPYTEDDDVKPTTTHHTHKLISEKEILKYPNNLVVRTGWLFDPTSDNGFIAAIKKEAFRKDTIISSIYQVGNPTSVFTLVDCLEFCIREGIVGIINCVNQGVATRYDYVRRIVNLVSNGKIVKPSHPEDFIRPSPVSSNESAVNYRLETEFGYFTKHWYEVLKI
jgi:dTDP-4-dehydrorhamnose reductase